MPTKLKHKNVKSRSPLMYFSAYKVTYNHYFHWSCKIHTIYDHIVALILNHFFFLVTSKALDIIRKQFILLVYSTVYPHKTNLLTDITSIHWLLKIKFYNICNLRSSSKVVNSNSTFWLLCDIYEILFPLLNITTLQMRKTKKFINVYGKSYFKNAL